MRVPAPGRALDAQAAVERLDAVGEAAQARAARGIGAADAVVGDHDAARGARTSVHADGRALGLGVLGDVRDRLGDDVVDGRLDRLGQALLGQLGELDRQRGARETASSAGPRPRSVRIAGWMPRASSRSSSSARASSRLRLDEQSERRRRGAARARSASAAAGSASETRRCCAPSWRLRSRRRRSASPASTMRAREAASLSWASAFASACATRLGEVAEALLGAGGERASRRSTTRRARPRGRRRARPARRRSSGSRASAGCRRAGAPSSGYVTRCASPVR